MPKTQRQPIRNGNGGGNGKVVPFPRNANTARPSPPSTNLHDPASYDHIQKAAESMKKLDLMGAPELIQAATYSQFKEVRNEALSRISHDWRMVRFVAYYCTHSDTRNEAQSLMEKGQEKERAGKEPSG